MIREDIIMFTMIQQTLKQRGHLDWREFDALRNSLQWGEVNSQQVLATSADLANHYVLIVDGLVAVRHKSHNSIGFVVRSFAQRGDFVGSGLSSRVIVDYEIEAVALETTKYVQVAKSVLDQTTIQSPNLRQIIDHAKTESNSAREIREIEISTLTPQARFEAFCRRSADLLGRVPQYMIANHIGVAPETLSRMRKKIYASRRN